MAALGRSGKALAQRTCFPDMNGSLLRMDLLPVVFEAAGSGFRLSDRAELLRGVRRAIHGNQRLRTRDGSVRREPMPR